MVFNFHLLVAIFAGAFVVILAGTGSIMEFEPELDRALHPRLSYVQPEKSFVSLADIGNRVSRRFSGEPIVAYFLSLEPDLSWQVALPRGIVYVNQYTGEVLGERSRGETFLGFIRDLHTGLAGAGMGRSVLEWSTIALLFSLASGFYLWWPTKQIRIRRMGRNRRLWSNLHNSIGILLLLPLAILATSGVLVGFEEELAPLVHRATASKPTNVNRSSGAIHVGTPAITADEAVAIARRLMPDAVPYRVQMPRYGGVYQIALSDAHAGVADDRNVVVLDPYGNVVSVMQPSMLSRSDRIFMLNEAIHTGSIWGMPSRIVACLVSTATLVQASSGLAMWIFRRKIVATSANSPKGTR